MKQDEFLNALSQGALALTPNRRLANVWIRRYAEQQTSPAWPQPTVLPLSDWCQQQWQTISLQRPLPVQLDTFQQHRLWRSIIAASADDSLMSVEQVATLAMDAWQQLQAWQLTLPPSARSNTEETRAFSEWLQMYLDRCQALNVCDETQRIPTLLQHGLSSSWPEHIIFCSFQAYTPAEQALRDKLAAETRVSEFQIQHEAPTIQRTAANDELEECLAMAHWAKAQPDNHHVACIITDLNQQQERVNRVFQQVLKDVPYNISAGNSLAEQPLVGTVLDLLSLATQPQRENVYRLLVSPFIAGDDQERFARAKHLESLLGQRQLDRSTLIEHLPSAWQERCRALVAMSETKAQSATQWIQQLTDCLSQWGWPSKALTSAQHTAHQQFMHCLQSASKLDVICPTPSFSEFYDYLSMICRQTVFHAATPEAKIQVLGVLEAAGIPFDAVWISGLDAEQWPPRPRLNPLLPIHFQIQHEMPHSSAERELSYCQQLLIGFLHSAQNITLSYAQRDQDIVRQPSRLMTDMTETDLNEIVNIPTPQHHPEPLIEYANPMVPIQTNETIRGGSQILQLQAACPFRAFAETRLEATPLPTPYHGLDAIDRGVLVHRCLEKIWQQIKTQQALARLSDEELEALCQPIIQRVISAYLAAEPKAIKNTLLELEQQRLLILIKQWLDYEKQRAPFRVVEVEKAIEVDICGLVLRLRIDRIDHIENLGYLIIDYKTGATSRNDWFDERPNAPQLPLYAISEAEIMGIAFAQIQLDASGFKGLSAHETDIPGIAMVEQLDESLDWQTCLHRWRKTLEQLVHDYQSGYAAVDPKHPAQSCQYCPLPTFCRIHETA